MPAQARCRAAQPAQGRSPRRRRLAIAASCGMIVRSVSVATAQPSAGGETEMLPQPRSGPRDSSIPTADPAAAAGRNPGRAGGEPHAGASLAPRAGLLPGLAAAVPGFFLHGTGTLVAGDRSTARLLRGTEMGALGVAALGLLPFAASGGSRRVARVAMPLSVSGTSAFLVSWLADIYGAVFGGGRTAEARQVWPAIEGRLALGYVDDPQFAHDSLAFVRVDARTGSWRATPSAWLALDHPTRRFRLEVARRFPASGSSFLAVQAAATIHRQGSDGFSIHTGETAAQGRLDLARVSPTLRGAFVELLAGWGVELYRFDSGDPLASALQLGRAAFGVYLGKGRGEAGLYYDHRHDGFAGGLGTGSVFDGPWGHVGASGWYYLRPPWGITAAVEAGSAYVAHVGLLVAWGPRWGS